MIDKFWLWYGSVSVLEAWSMFIGLLFIMPFLFKVAQSIVHQIFVFFSNGITKVEVVYVDKNNKFIKSENVEVKNREELIKVLLEARESRLGTDIKKKEVGLVR